MNPELKKEEKAEIWVAVLHYRGAEESRLCLNSILSLDYRPFQILITDNCSPDNSGESLRSDFPQCHYQVLPKNLGFAGGSNASIRYCIERGAQWVWILNNDTSLDADSLSALLAEARTNDRAGILGAAVYTPSTTGFHRSGLGQIDFAKAKTYERGAIDESKSSIECPWLSGSNMLVRSAAFNETNGFDEDFFLYFEDTDLCWRMNKLNWKCLLVPKAKLKHTGNASTQGQLAIWRSYYHTRNRLLFFLKIRGGITSLPILFAVFTHLLRHCIVLPFRGKDGRRQLKAELLGLRDYFAGNLGEANCLDF